MAQLQNTTINDTGYLQLPVGSTAQRPTVTSKVQTFSSPGTWTAPTGVTNIELLIVAGGGGTNTDVGGGGGAGGVVYAQTFPVSPGTSYPITVGSGGASIQTQGSPGNPGGPSTAFGLTAVGGGGGGGYPSSGAGQPGGSGGGGGDQVFGTGGGGGYSGPGSPGGTGTQPSQNAPFAPLGIQQYGFPGGNGGPAWFGAGGGGAGGAGSGAGGQPQYNGQGGGGLPSSAGGMMVGGGSGFSASAYVDGRQYIANGNAGGPGITFSISGTPTTYAQGGWGSFSDGGIEFAPVATPGSGATGSGQNTGFHPGTPGIVIIKYLIPGNTDPSGLIRHNSTLGALELNDGSGFNALQPNTGNNVIKFTEVGSYTWTVPAGIYYVRVLVVAGGGGGAQRHGGGGGGGGMLEHYAYPVTPGQGIPVVVGAGGGVAYQGSPASQYGNPGMPGGPSSFGAIVTTGGGAGYSDGGWPNQPFYVDSGGSGGGGAHNGAHSGTAIPGQGYPGGGATGNTSTGYNSQYYRNQTGPYPGSGNPYAGGGGGGAGGGGQPSLNNSTAGNGGPGRHSDITGTIQYYAGGGGSGTTSSQSTGAAGGIGGGGHGGGNGYYTPGLPNTGGGGGCGNNTGPSGGTGGPGIVIVRY